MLLQHLRIYDRLRSAILPLSEIDNALPKKGKITELGCGQGVISKYLAMRKDRYVLGIDLNKERIGKSKNRNLQFKVGDITRNVYKLHDGFVISDVLHHLSLEGQKILLTKLHKALKDDGLLIIKEIDTNEIIRSRLSRFWDFIFYPNDKINYWNSKELKTYLEKLGFQVSIQRPCRFFPGSTTLFICTKNV
jgi:2-polyprenyl-3-methyl-5-hydroxy-6-metoxy-1,4-benzoquinol methylase